jgi:large subunit ribosomal protein L10
MKKKSQKHEDVDALRKQLEQNPHLFVASFQKLTVQQDFELRKSVRGAGGNYKVVKNNLAAKASEGTPAAPALTNLAGMTSIAYTITDPVALAKALTTYAKANPTLTFKAGVVEGRVIDVQSIADLASLPSREEVLAKVLFLINASAQRLVTAVSGVGRNLAVVVDQGVKENKFNE